MEAGKESLHWNEVPVMKWMQILANPGRSECSAGMPHPLEENGKLEVRGGFFQVQKVKRENHWYSREKRQIPRYHDGQEVFCYLDDSRPIIARIMDAGSGGLRVRTDSSLEIGSFMSLVVKFNNELAQVHVRILWQKTSQGACEYGVSFSAADQRGNSPLRRYIASLRAMGKRLKARVTSHTSRAFYFDQGGRLSMVPGLG